MLFGVVLAGVAWLSTTPAPAQEFRHLTAAEIRAQIIGRNITDASHWTEYYRRDGVLLIEDSGQRKTGRWAIERDMLCTITDRTARRCWQVWASGPEVSLRERPQDRPPPAFVLPHQGP